MFVYNNNNATLLHVNDEIFGGALNNHHLMPTVIKIMCETYSVDVTCSLI